MRRARWILPALIAGLLAACGGDDESGSATETEKPALTVPGESTDTTTESTDTTTESTETAPSGDGGSQTGPMDQPNPGNGGVPAPDNNNPPADQPPRDLPSNDTPPEPGSPADRFEQFCTENPGAC